MKKLILLGLFLITASISAQESINQYKYIVVPKKFDFLKEPNQYRVNTFTKFLFEKNGFTAIYDDNQPQDLRMNPCLGLIANIEDHSNLFSTKLNITLKNCQGLIVYTSEEGKSKIKEYEGAYQDAIKDAFVSVRGLNYHYTPAENNVALLPASAQAPVAQVPVAAQAPTTAVQAPVAQVPAKVVEVATANAVDQVTEVLYAQPTANGFQLVDSSPKVIYKLTKTTQPNYFLIQGGNGFVYQKDGRWIAEYYEGQTLKQEVLNIKF
ncbi:hypothetical protein [Galbibacter sp.]|jgi:hypothetical protein|uniref:hypothetical protein n=1 Tax=Galbibacter sp. TaxID=2918471 RepID=UPI003A8CF212